LAANAKAEVFDTGRREGPNQFTAERIVGCVYGQTHAYVIGSAPSGSGTAGGGSEIKALAGVMVAVERGAFNIFYGSYNFLVLEDLLTDHTLYESNLPGLATSVVLKQNGSVAWITSTQLSSAAIPHKEWVYAFDAAGKRLLAQGQAVGEATEIGLRSLALSHDEHTVYWTQGGKPYAASLYRGSVVRSCAAS
jgi:hypothetical protein